MKKLLIAAAIISTTLLFGCSEEKKETVDSLRNYLETREDMLPYNLEFENLGFLEIEPGNNMLCGKILVSRKSSLSRVPPIMVSSNPKKDISDVIDSKKYFHFYYLTKPNPQDPLKKQPIIIVDMYDIELLESWNNLCK
ncbi:hypothetical protein AB7459_04115 [Providencia rettgeri]